MKEKKIKSNLLVDISRVWECPRCQRFILRQMRKCVCGYEYSGEILNDKERVGQVWQCPTCLASNVHMRARCACGTERPFGATSMGRKSAVEEDFKARRKLKTIAEKMTKTEHRFLTMRLEPMLGKTIATIIPQVTLPFNDGTRYTIDFFVVMLDGTVRCFEVKGGYKLTYAWAEQGLERFRRAREKWPTLNFELWQWEKGTWLKKY